MKAGRHSFGLLLAAHGERRKDADNAAVARLEKLYVGGQQGKILRISVNTRGCSGMSYELGWDDTAAEDDKVIESQGIKVFVDEHSAPYIQGSEIDYVDNNMMGAGFAIKNPNVKSSCGCGHSFKTAGDSSQARACGCGH